MSGKINDLNIEESVTTINYDISRNGRPVVDNKTENKVTVNVQEELMGGAAPRKYQFKTQYLMDSQNHMVFAVPNDYFDASIDGKSADFVELNGTYHKLVEISDTSDLETGLDESIPKKTNWNQPSNYKYRLLRVVSPINGIVEPSYKVETVTLYHLPDESDIYNYVRLTNFDNTPVDNFPYQFDGKTTEYATVSKNCIKEDIGLTLDFLGDKLNPDIPEEIRYPIAKYEITRQPNPTDPNNTITEKSLVTMDRNTIQLVNNDLLDDEFIDVMAPSIHGVNTYFGEFSGHFEYNFTGLGLVLDTINTIGSRRNKLNTVLKYKGDSEYSTSLFNNNGPRIMLPIEQNIYNTTISQNSFNIVPNENKLLKLENDFYSLQKWEINNNQLTITEGATVIQTTNIEKTDNTLVVKSLQLPDLSSSSVSQQKTEQFRNSSLTNDSNRAVADLIIAKYLEEFVEKMDASETTSNDTKTTGETHKNSEILLTSLIVKLKTDEAIQEMEDKLSKESEDELATQLLLKEIEDRIQNILSQQIESYPDLSKVDIPKIKEGLMAPLLVDNNAVSGDLYFVKTTANNGLSVYKLDSNQELNNKWFIGRFGIDNKQYMIDTTALILDIDDDNNMNKSDGNNNQNVLKDLFEFDSATNIPLYNSSGILTSKCLETYDLFDSGEKWTNRSNIVNDLYNNTRFVYQSDIVEYRTVENSELNNNDTQGNLIENKIYYLHNKETDADAFIRDWKHLDGYNVEDYYGDHSYSFRKQRKTTDLNNIDISLKPGQIFFVMVNLKGDWIVIGQIIH